MSYRFLLVLLLSFYSYAAYSENQGLAINSTELCSYYGEPLPHLVHTFAPDYKTEDMINRIVAYSGLRQNFNVVASNVPNAAAITRSGERYLLYNQEFMSTATQKTHTYWAAISIMAHEIGHHLQGHTLDGSGSRPEKEIEADEYSGFILQKMGASLEEAQAVINIFGSNEGSTTHPPKESRLRAIRAGWTRSLELNAMMKKHTAAGFVDKSSQTASRYELNDGLVTDVTTRLIWTRCSIGQTWNGSTCKGEPTKYSWHQIATKHFDFAGYNDWRLPSSEELKSLLDCQGKPSKKNRACKGKSVKRAVISKAFPNTPKNTPFWSSSMDSDNVDGAWVVDFSNGKERYNHKNHSFAIRLVRNM